MKRSLDKENIEEHTECETKKFGKKNDICCDWHDFPDLVTHCLRRLRKNIDDYKSAQVWRTAFRMALEGSIQDASVFMSMITQPELESEWNKLQKSYVKATNGATLLRLTHSPSDEKEEVMRLIVNDTKSETKYTSTEFPPSVLKSVMQYVQLIRIRKEQDELKKEIQEGRVILHLETGENLKNQMKTYWRECILFMQVDADNYRMDYLMEAWPFPEGVEDNDAVEKFCLFKTLWNQFGTHCVFFYKAIDVAQNHPDYLKFLICDWGIGCSNQHKLFDYIFVPNLITLQLYHQAYLQSGRTNKDFAIHMIHDVGGSKNEKDSKIIGEMLDFIWGLPETGLPAERTEIPLMTWLKEVYFNSRDSLKRFIVVGYIDMNPDQLVDRCHQYDLKFSSLNRDKKAYEESRKKEHQKSEFLYTYRESSELSARGQTLAKREKDLEVEHSLIQEMIQHKQCLEEPESVNTKILEWVKKHAAWILPDKFKTDTAEDSEESD
jgi:hypothetical protein